MGSGKQGHRVAVFARKGGAGKTTVTVLLARELIRWGCKVLVVDTDPQSAGSTWALGLDVNRPLASTSLDLVKGRPVLPTTIALGRLDLIPVSQREAGMEHVMRDQWRQLMAASGGKEPRRGILDARLRTVVDAYDYVLIDCPTALGEVTLNALEAVDLVISPLDLGMPGNAQSAVDLEEQLARTTRRPAVRFVGNKWSPEKEQRRLAWAEAERLCGANLLREFRIPDVEAIKKAIFHGKGIERFGARGPGAEASQAFYDLAYEVTTFFEKRQVVGNAT